jgi:protein-disulfide isomerase
MKTTRGSLSTSSAIIIAGALIAVALIWTHKPARSGAPLVGTLSPTDQTLPENAGIAAVTASDHILGNPNAPIKLVEYSDLSCPYCREMNSSLVQLMAQYGPSGKVAWVYRSLPLLMKPIDNQGTIPHPNSGMQAQALECVAQLGGNTAFFDFEKQWFSTFPDGGELRNATIDRAAIDSLSKRVGVDPVSFNDCMASNRYTQKINDAYDAGIAAGITGTPTTYVFTPSGSKIPLIGVQPYATLKATIDTLMSTITTIGTSTPGIKN